MSINHARLFREGQGGAQVDGGHCPAGIGGGCSAWNGSPKYSNSALLRTVASQHVYDAEILDEKELSV
ncbi:hypothetical protein SBV1_470006 [Verrucomicrobia bacterium]|nr:hypothetical protein SBV1_470006 [Verrucomicrobiota bacterium]